jgi:hypothetical protein
MNTTRFARDHNGASVGITHWKWGSRQVFASSAASARCANPLDEHMVFVAPATHCHVRMGDASVVATEADPVLRAGNVYCFPRARGEDYVAVRTVTGGADGSVEIWEADSYRES